jgi:hypothetical protein
VLVRPEEVKALPYDPAVAVETSETSELATNMCEKGKTGQHPRMISSGLSKNGKA